MPLSTEIIRDGEALQIGWGGFHVAAMIIAAMFEDDEGPFAEAKPNDDLDYPTDPQPISPGDVFQLVSYPVVQAAIGSERVLMREHRFLDPTDGEVLELLPGDKLVAWRSSSSL